MNNPVQSLSKAKDRKKMIYWLFGLLAVAAGLLGVIFWSGLTAMVAWWSREEYSHGYMIPFVAAFLVWQKINKLPSFSTRGSWFGVALLAIGLLCFFIGELSSIYTIIQYGFLISIYGLFISFFGTRGFSLLAMPLLYLVFMIPLPNFLYNNLSSQLQLLSSSLGVYIIRLFNISVNLEGNVIDLGAMQLQVAEACSGLRYLFPLMSFGFLIGYLYRGPLWQRAVIFLTTIPITVLMNSFRIGMIGVTVDKWGIEMAQGFLHDFEGWVVFMGCVGILFLEIFLFQLLCSQRRGVLELINLDLPRLSVKLRDFDLSIHKQHAFLVALILLFIATPYFATLSKREEVSPPRQTFNQFPLAHKNWLGSEGSLERNIIETLKFSDYIIADYHTNSDPIPVNFYTAWYESQKKGESIHSPRTCIPGGGWRIRDLDQRSLTDVKRANGKPLRVNRVLIQKGDIFNVVYYWFEGRNRDITNEYLEKWYIFWDSLTRSRSDGALIRVVTTVPEGGSIASADQRLQQFLKDFYPLIPAYVP